MKKLLISCLVLFSVFICFASGHYHNRDTWTTNGSGSASYNTYNGTVAHCNSANSGNGNITYSITMYSMPNSSSAWSTYVNNGYRLKYIGGTYWYNTSNSWSSESNWSNLNDFIYPSYVDYLRPY